MPYKLILFNKGPHFLTNALDLKKYADEQTAPAGYARQENLSAFCMRTLEPVYIGWAFFTLQLLIVTQIVRNTTKPKSKKKCLYKKSFKALKEQKWFAWTVLCVQKIRVT